MNVTSAKLEVPALNCSAAHQRLKASGYANGMAGEALALKPQQADNVAPPPRPFMDARPAKREPNAA